MNESVSPNRSNLIGPFSETLSQIQVGHTLECRVTSTTNPHLPFAQYKMKGRSVSYAYSMIILVFCCGYSVACGGILLNKHLIPACIIVYAALYGVYWLKKHRNLTAAVLFSTLVKVHLFDYLLITVIWYYNLKDRLRPFWYELISFSIALVLIAVSFVLMRVFAFGYQIFVGFALSVVLNESLYTFFPVGTKLGNWGFVPWATSSIIVFFCCLFFSQNFCKICLPIVSAYVITLTMSLCHKQDLLRIDPEVLNPLEYNVKHNMNVEAQMIQSFDKFKTLSSQMKHNDSEKAYLDLLKRLFANLPSLSSPPTEGEVKQFVQNYVAKFPRAVFQDRFYVVVFVLLAILLGIIALFTAKSEKTKEAAKT